MDTPQVQKTLADYDIPLALPKGTLSQAELVILSKIIQQVASLIHGQLDGVEAFDSQAEGSFKFSKKNIANSFKITIKGKLYDTVPDVDPNPSPEQTVVHMELELEPIEGNNETV